MGEVLEQIKDILQYICLESYARLIEVGIKNVAVQMSKKLWLQSTSSIDACFLLANNRVLKQFDRINASHCLDSIPCSPRTRLYEFDNRNTATDWVDRNSIR